MVFPKLAQLGPKGMDMFYTIWYLSFRFAFEYVVYSFIFFFFYKPQDGKCNYVYEQGLETICFQTVVDFHL